MKRTDSSPDLSDSRSSRHVDRMPRGRDNEERARLEERRRQWIRQQEKEREHERLKRKKIEEYERKRKAQKEENRRKSRTGRSSYGSHDGSKSVSPDNRRSDKPENDTSKTPIMSQKRESSENSARLFKGPEGSTIDLAELRRIKVDIHRKIVATEISNELQREIVDPEDVKVKRREGEGSKPIFEREELKKPIHSVPEVEEHRTVVALSDEKTERRQHATKKRPASPSSPSRSSSSRHIDNRDARYASSRHKFDRFTDHKSHKHESEKNRSRSKEYRDKSRVDDTRGRHSPRRSRHDTTRDHRDHRNRSHSDERESRRNRIRNRSSRELSDREHRGREDSRDRRSRNDRSRERRIQMSQHYPEAIPVPMYYEGYHPRPIMVGPMMPIPPPMAMGRGGIRPMMGPMRPPYPPRFFAPEIFRPAMHPNPRYSGMY